LPRARPARRAVSSRISTVVLIPCIMACRRPHVARNEIAHGLSSESALGLPFVSRRSRVRGRAMQGDGGRSPLSSTRRAARSDLVPAALRATSAVTSTSPGPACAATRAARFTFVRSSRRPWKTTGPALYAGMDRRRASAGPSRTICRAVRTAPAGWVEIHHHAVPSHFTGLPPCSAEVACANRGQVRGQRRRGPVAELHP